MSGNGNWHRRGGKINSKNRGSFKGQHGIDRPDINSRLGPGHNSNNFASLSEDEPRGSRNNQGKPNNPYRNNRTNARHRNKQSETASDGSVELIILGFGDNSIKSLLDFLDERIGIPLDISEYRRVNGDTIIKVKSKEFAKKVVAISGTPFAGNILTIQYANGGDKGGSDSKAEIRKALDAYIESNYDDKLKLLNLSKVDNNPILKEAGLNAERLFNSGANLLSVLAQLAKRKGCKPLMIDFSNNQIKRLNRIASMAEVFPEVTHLSFACNNLASFSALDSLANSKMRDIECLIFFDNPFRKINIEKTGDEIEYRSKITTLFPKLKLLDDHLVKQGPSFGIENLVSNQKLPFPVCPASHATEFSHGLTNLFCSQFFGVFDTNRESLINYYSESSLFSLSLNILDPGKSRFNFADRNLKRTTTLQSRTARLYFGAEAIINLFQKLPVTSHPTDRPTRFMVDSWEINDMIPYHCTQGVSRKYIKMVVHGEFFDKSVNKSRSFSRSITLGPSEPGSRSELAGLDFTIVNDMLIIRRFVTSPAWEKALVQTQYESQQLPPTQPFPQQMQAQPQAQIINPMVNFNQPPAPSSTQQPVQSFTQQPATMRVTQATLQPPTQDQQQPPAAAPEIFTPEQKQAIQQILAQTKLTEEFALMCLAECDWDVELSLTAYKSATEAGELPPKALRQ